MDKSYVLRSGGGSVMLTAFSDFVHGTEPSAVLDRCRDGGVAMAGHTEALDELLTPAQVAGILYVDPKTVTRWAKAGKIDSVLTPGGHRRFLRSDVLALLTGGRQSHPALVLSSAVVTEAVDLALDAEAEAEAAVAALLVSVASLADAADVAIRAAVRARAARAFDAAETARSVAGDAAASAEAIKVQAETAATRVVQAAALAASIIIASSTSGLDETSSLAAHRVAATLRAAADAMAHESTSAAASIASTVASAATQLATATRHGAIGPETSVDDVAPQPPGLSSIPSPRVSVEATAVCSA